MRALTAAVSLTVVASALFAPSVYAVNLCTDGDGSHDHITVSRNADGAGVPGDYFDLVRGEVAARDLDVCVGQAGEGATFILPANIENFVTTRIFQLGYGQRTTDADELFFYAATTTAAKVWPTSSFKPIDGHGYRFSIWATTTGQYERPQFGIRDLTTRASSFYVDIASVWTVNYKQAWWGAETWGSDSDHGAHDGSPVTILRYLGYSPDTDGSIIYRSGMVDGYIPNGDIFRGPGIPGNHHGHITDWVFDNDALHVETH